MIQKLVIRNYAIIDSLTLEPDAHLNTVTGETGAGKSIILGALSLILGERADSSVLINKQEKCVVEARFDVRDHASFRDALAEEDIDNEEQCIIRREISTSGKSRAFVNDTPVTLNVLNRLTSHLVDLHQQFDHLALEDDEFQMNVIDALSGTAATKKSYSALFREYKSIGRQLAEKKAVQARWQKESDYKQYLLDELAQAAFQENEIEEAEQQLRQLSHTERILSVMEGVRIALDEGEQPVLNELRRILQQLQGISDLMPAVTPLRDRISGAWAELKDVAGELESLQSTLTLDPATMQKMQERMDLGYKLFKKHDVRTTEELLSIQQQLELGLKETLDLNDQIESLTAELAAVRLKLLAEGEKLSAMRKKTAPLVAKKITQLLGLVGMPNARFRIDITPAGEPVPSGLDEVSFLLDANKSDNFLPIYKAASGGEMSRIMLCIKSLTAEAMQLPTLIFDEVDTGISGEAARQVSILLRDLAQYHQVICITHQAQVAARGSRHFYVYKDASDASRITTKVKILKADEHVLAIARMIGGEQPSEAALQNARELVAH